MSKSYSEFERQQANAHEFRAWSQQTPMSPDNAVEDEVAPPQPPLREGSFGESCAAIVNEEVFWRVLASLGLDEKVRRDFNE